MNQDTLNDSVLPEFEVLSRDYRLVSLMSVVFSMYICILQYWYSGHATMSSIVALKLSRPFTTSSTIQPVGFS